MIVWSRTADFGASELAAGTCRGSKSPVASIAPSMIEPADSFIRCALKISGAKLSSTSRPEWKTIGPAARFCLGPFPNFPASFPKMGPLGGRGMRISSDTADGRRTSARLLGLKPFLFTTALNDR